MIILLDRNDLKEEYKEKPATDIYLLGSSSRMFFLNMTTIANAHVICFHCNVEDKWFVKGGDEAGEKANCPVRHSFADKIDQITGKHPEDNIQDSDI